MMFMIGEHVQSLNIGRNSDNWNVNDGTWLPCCDEIVVRSCPIGKWVTWSCCGVKPPSTNQSSGILPLWETRRSIVYLSLFAPNETRRATRRPANASFHHDESNILKMSRRNNVRGPTSALTEFLRVRLTPIFTLRLLYKINFQADKWMGLCRYRNPGSPRRLSRGGRELVKSRSPLQGRVMPLRLKTKKEMTMPPVRLTRRKYVVESLRRPPMLINCLCYREIDALHQWLS